MTGVTLHRGSVVLRGTVAGTGSTALLLHAGRERRSVWYPVMGRLKDAGLRTVAYDQRGHGDSTGNATSFDEFSDDVRAMVGNETGKVVLVGASLGGLAALAALSDPGTLGAAVGLVLVDVVPDPSPQIARTWLGRRGLLSEGTELVDDILGRGAELMNIAASLEIPILLVRGGRDSPLGDDDVERFRRANPLAMITSIAAAGHLVARDAPHELGTVIAEHSLRWLSATRSDSSPPMSYERTPNMELPNQLDAVSTAHLADACRILDTEVRCAPPAVRPVNHENARFAGVAQPVRHTGSVDVIFEALDKMVPGAVLVVDDDGRTDRACIGDLAALEARNAGAAAITVNGLHRDTGELIELGLPVVSLGSSPTGPLDSTPSPPDALECCRLGNWSVTHDDIVVGDRDGVIVLPADRIDDLVDTAGTIRKRERQQAHLAHDGTSLREQFEFDAYLEARKRDPERTFRQHLSDRAAAIEA